MKRNAEKEAKKKRADTPMDTSPDARVMDILDQHLKQLGLIRRKSWSNSPASSKSRSATPGSRMRSKSVSTSHGSFCSSGSSRNSSHNFRGHSRSSLKQNSTNKKSTVKKRSVTFYWSSHSTFSKASQ